MKKTLVVLSTTLGASVFYGLCIFGFFNQNSAEAATVKKTVGLVFKCHDFNQNLSLEESKTNKSLLDWATLGGKVDQITKYKKMVSSYTADITALQAVFEKEGFTISVFEKAQSQIGATTVKALESFKTKYKDKIVGVSLQSSLKSGLVDSATRSVLNQKYACTADLITLSLTEPTADTFGHIGSVIPVKWTASSTLATFTKVRIILVDLVSNKETVVKEVSPTVKSLDYTIPSSGMQGPLVGMGSYTDARYRVDVVALDISGAVLQTVQSKPFRIGPKVALFVATKPNKGDRIELGSSFKVGWSAQNIPNTSAWVRIDLFRKDGSLAQTLSVNKVMVSAQFAPITLSNTIETGIYTIKITAVLVGGTELQGSTGEFSIINKQPKVALLTPNTSAEYKINKAITINWSAKNLPETMSAFDVYFIDTTATTSIKIGSTTRSALTLPWTAPQNGILGSGKDKIPGIGDTKTKKYKIEVRAVDQSGLTITSDQSDSNFAIIQ